MSRTIINESRLFGQTVEHGYQEIIKIIRQTKQTNNLIGLKNLHEIKIPIFRGLGHK